MQHAPMNTVVSILAAALSTLYLQLLSMLVVLAGYYVMYNHFTVYDAVGFMEMFFVCVGIGMRNWHIVLWVNALGAQFYFTALNNLSTR